MTVLLEYIDLLAGAYLYWTNRFVVLSNLFTTVCCKVGGPWPLWPPCGPPVPTPLVVTIKIMYCRCFFLLLTLFAAIVASQSGDDAQCFEAALALAANRPCANAGEVIAESVDTNSSANTNISIEVLNAYCTPNCRALNNRVLTACSGLTVDITQLYCTVHGGVSCYDVVTAFTDGMQDGVLEAQVACAIEGPTDAGQTCSPGCTMAIQNFINAGGCCFVETLETVDQLTPNQPNATSADIVGLILSACPGVNRLENT